MPGPKPKYPIQLLDHELEELAQAILDFIWCGNETVQPINWTYTVEKLEKKLGMK